MLVQDVTESVTIRGMVCGGCGCAFGLAKQMYDTRIEDEKFFYCPRGCYIRFRSVTAKDREIKTLKSKLASAQSRADYLAERTAQAVRSRNAVKGHLTRKKKRVANGVCPCCQRTVQQLARHMKTKHPAWVRQNG